MVTERHLWLHKPSGNSLPHGRPDSLCGRLSCGSQWPQFTPNPSQRIRSVDLVRAAAARILGAEFYRPMHSDRHREHGLRRRLSSRRKNRAPSSGSRSRDSTHWRKSETFRAVRDLGFDSFGRLAVMDQGAYVVLNDSTWIDIADKKVSGPRIRHVVFGPEGRGYYGALGSWGLLEFTAQGLLRPQPLMPAVFPKWVMASTFTDIVPTAERSLFCRIQWRGLLGPRLQ